jgi:hypothetical protein
VKVLAVVRFALMKSGLARRNIARKYARVNSLSGRDALQEVEKCITLESMV